MNTTLDKNKLKDILVKRISDDENFKQEFARNPQIAIGTIFEKDLLDNLKIETDRETSGIIHVKISDKKRSASGEEKDYIHLIMLDKTS